MAANNNNNNNIGRGIDEQTLTAILKAAITAIKGSEKQEEQEGEENSIPTYKQRKEMKIEELWDSLKEFPWDMDYQMSEKKEFNKKIKEYVNKPGVQESVERALGRRENEEVRKAYTAAKDKMYALRSVYNTMMEYQEEMEKRVEDETDEEKRERIEGKMKNMMIALAFEMAKAKIDARNIARKALRLGKTENTTKEYITTAEDEEEAQYARQEDMLRAASRQQHYHSASSRGNGYRGGRGGRGYQPRGRGGRGRGGWRY